MCNAPHRHVLGVRDLSGVGVETSPAAPAGEELRGFWDDTHELVKTFGTPELDDQVRTLDESSNYLRRKSETQV